MRELTRKAGIGLLVTLTAAGCANMRNREWGSCAIAGGVLGAAVGGITGGAAMNNADNNADNADRGAAIGGGIVGGAALGALLGHVICDPEKVAAAPPPPAPPPPAGTKLATLKGPNFDFDKAQLTKSGEKLVDGAVTVLKDNPSVNASIEGHTDSVGTDAYNQKLSERRANAVRDYMVKAGIAASRITTKGWGESKPVASNKTAEARAENRRVEIITR